MKRKFLLPAAFLALLSAAAPCGAKAQSAGDARAPGDRHAFADALFVRGLYAKAAAEYRGLLESGTKLPDADLCWFRLGESERLAGRREEAIVAYGKVIDTPTSAYRTKALFKKAAVFTELGVDNAAEELFRLLLSEKPEPEVRERALYYHAAALEGLGRLREAVADLDAELREFPQGEMAPYARLSLGRILALPGPERDLSRAHAVLKPVSDRPPTPRLGAEALFLAATAEHDASNHVAAAVSFHDLFEKYPADERVADARFPASWSFLLSNRPKDAVACAEAALAADPPPSPGKAVELRYIRAQGLFDLARLSEAAEAFATLAADPSAAGSPFAGIAAYQTALAFFNAGKFAEVQTALRPVLADPAMREKALWLLAEAAMAVPDGAQSDVAIQSYRLFESEFPGDPKAPDALYRLGALLRGRGSWNDAAAAYRSLADRYGSSPLAPRARFAAAASLGDSGQDVAALAEWQTYLRDFPQAEGVPEALFQKGAALMRLDRKAEALSAFDELLRRFPSSARTASAQFYRGVLLRETGSVKEAAAAFRAAFAGATTDAIRGNAKFQLAMALQASGETAEAAKLFQELLDDPVRDRFSPSQYAWLAEWQCDAGQFDRAAETARKMAEAADSDAWRQQAWTIAGRAFLAAKKAREAEDAYLKACSLPVFTVYAPEATIRLGQLLLDRGAAPDAERWFRVAAARCSSPDMAPFRNLAYVGIGRSRLAAGDKQDAADYLLTACLIANDPETFPPILRETIVLLDELGRKDEADALRDKLESDYPDAK